jgi:hypothetical protein
MAALHIARLKELSVEKLIKKHDEVADNTSSEGVTTIRDELPYRESATQTAAIVKMTRQMRFATWVILGLTIINAAAAVVAVMRQ